MRTDPEYDALVDDDRDRLVDINNAPDAVTIVALIRAYYSDLDRANRTPRDVMYLHLGMLTGAFERVLFP